MTVTLLIVVLSFQTITTQGEFQAIIYQVHDLVLKTNESFTTSLVLEPFAPYSIISEINVTNEAIIEPIVTISIRDVSLSGYTIFHRGDRPYANVTWTPQASDYTIEIENNGEVDAVEVSVTITQTGPPNTSHLAPDHLILSALDLLFFLFVFPVGLLAIVLLLYRHRQTHRTVV